MKTVVGEEGTARSESRKERATRNKPSQRLAAELSLLRGGQLPGPGGDEAVRTLLLRWE